MTYRSTSPPKEIFHRISLVAMGSSHPGGSEFPGLFVLDNSGRKRILVCKLEIKKNI
jgi:hypothetical protein